MNNPTLNETETNTDVLVEVKEKNNSSKLLKGLFYFYSFIHCSFFLAAMIFLDHQKFAEIQKNPMFLSLIIAGFAIPFVLRFKSRIKNVLTYFVLTLSVLTGFVGAYSQLNNSTMIDTVLDTKQYVEHTFYVQISSYQEQQARIELLKSLRDIKAEESPSQNVFEVISSNEADTAIKAFINSPHGISSFVYARFIYGDASHIKTTADGGRYWSYMILFAIGLQLWLHAGKEGVKLLKAVKQIGFFGTLFLTMVFSFFGACVGFLFSIFAMNESVMPSFILGSFIATIVLKIQANLYIKKTDDKYEVSGGFAYYFIGIPLFTHVFATLLSAIKGFGYLSLGGGFWIENFGFVTAISIAIAFFSFFYIYDKIEEKRFSKKNQNPEVE